MTAPLVSILVPTYNGERFLEAALRSALAQSHRAIEVVVGDDASTDGTPELLATVAASDDRVRVIRHHDNLGPFLNPPALLRAARGEYVKFLLHDDLLAENCVEVLLEGLTSAPGTTMAFSRRQLIDEHGLPVQGHAYPELAERSGTVSGLALGDVVLGTCTNVIGELTTVLFRRDAVDADTMFQLDGRRMAANGDVALWLRLLADGNAWYTPEVLSSFRQHAGQSTQDPRVQAAGIRDWPLLVDWGRRQGFLADREKQRQAHARVLAVAAQVHASFLGSPDSTLALEAMHLSMTRLLELRTGVGVDAAEPLSARAHGAPALGRLAQELDVWSRPRPLAIASPAPDAAEVTATVQALREVWTTGAAERLLIATPHGDVPRVVELVEAALSTGPDVDVELFPVDDPAELLPGSSLAVAPWGSTWHRGRAEAVWSFPVAAPPA